MPEVIVRKGEPVDRALKRLKNKLDAEGILEEVRRLRAFETPNTKEPSQGQGQRQARPDQVPFQSVAKSPFSKHLTRRAGEIAKNSPLCRVSTYRAGLTSHSHTIRKPRSLQE